MPDSICCVNTSLVLLLLTLLDGKLPETLREIKRQFREAEVTFLLHLGLLYSFSYISDAVCCLAVFLVLFRFASPPHSSCVLSSLNALDGTPCVPNIARMFISVLLLLLGLQFGL